MRICYKILVFVWFAIAWLPSWGRPFADTLRVDYLTHDTDLWTCGQLILFSSKEPVSWDEHGRVVSGMLGINTLILCADNRFREFARDFHVSFDENGSLVSGTMVTALEIEIQEQSITSMPYTEVAFFPNGVVKYFVTSGNFRYVSAEGFRFTIAQGSKVTFDEYGRLRTAVMARRRVMQRSDGSERVFLPGDVINLDQWGRVE